MAVTFLKRSNLPAPVRGKAGTMSITITGKGQVIFSSLATKALKGAERVAVGYENGKGMFFLPTAPLVVKAKIPVEYMQGLNHNKKTGQASFAGTVILDDKETFVDYLYDFRKSGNQTFAVTVDEKNQVLTFPLHNGALTAKPVVARPRKSKTKVNGVAAEVGSDMALPTPETELVLELT